MTVTTTTPFAAFHRAHGTGASYWGPGDLYTFLVTGDESGGRYFSMLAVVPPDGGPPPHTHSAEDETFYVLEGTPTFRLGDERIRVDVLHERVRQAMVNRSRKEVFLRGDGGVMLQELMEVVDKLKDGGVENVGIVTRLPERP